MQRTTDAAARTRRATFVEQLLAAVEAKGMAVATANVRDFKRVPGLTVVPV